MLCLNYTGLCGPGASQHLAALSAALQGPRVSSEEERGWNEYDDEDEDDAEGGRDQ